jgi:hypothetical protein
MAKYSIEVNDYTNLMILALISELLVKDEKIADEDRIDDFQMKMYLPQVMNWLLFEFDVSVSLLVDSDNFDKEEKLWALVMKSAENLAAQIRAHLEDEGHE